jgi:integrase
MASVFERNGRWIAKYKDGRGRWKTVSTKARTKTEAKRLAHELELKGERQRMGLEELPPDDGGGTLAELLDWWLDTYVRRTTSFERTRAAVERNILSSEIAGLRLVDVTPGKIEVFLQAQSDRLGPDSLNHLRSFMGTAFNRAIEAERWKGMNPALRTRRRKVPKRLPAFLRADEVPRMLAALPIARRPLFACAVYTGMRKGELAGLRKTDVDFSSGLINVCRSYDHDTTKGSRQAAIPIADALRPYLQRAIKDSEGDLVFPGPNGNMMTMYTPLENVLRAALGRAGIVERYEHVCRKKGCGFIERASDAALRRCPTHGHKLWPKAVVRPIRFHSLRHTTASLLMMAGANPASVQRILRHSDPRITTEVYGHLVPEYLRDEVNRLKFDPPNALQEDADLDSPFGAPVVRVLSEALRTQSGPEANPLESLQKDAARPVGFEPTTLGFEAAATGLTDPSNASQTVGTIVVGTSGQVQASQPVAGFGEGFGAPVVRGERRRHRRKHPSPTLAERARALRRARHGVRGPGVSLLTVAEVAKLLRVCTATVYAMVERGELEHVRVSNSIRIVVGGVGTRTCF